MAYPERLLVDDEEVVERLHPAGVTLTGPVVWFVVVCALLGLAVAYAPGGGTTHEAVVLAATVIAVGLILWRSVAPWLRWSNTVYVLTTHRVLVRRGVLRRVGRDIPLGRISDVGYSQSLWERLARAGTVTIESAGEHGVEVLRDVPRADRTQAILNRLIDEDVDRRARRRW